MENNRSGYSSSLEQDLRCDNPNAPWTDDDLEDYCGDYGFIEEDEL